MEPVNKISISKKSLKVAIKEPTNNIGLTVNEPINEVVNSQETKEDLSLEASKSQKKLTKKGKPDGRGTNLENLKIGRAKLAASWAEKRRIKEELEKAALQKKVDLALKQERLIRQAYRLESESEEDTDIESGLESDPEPEPEPKCKSKPKPLTKPKKQVESKTVPEPKSKPKKKVIKYVEVESESEEEEIVYVKKSKKQPQMQQYIPQQYDYQQPVVPSKPNITFW